MSNTLQELAELVHGKVVGDGSLVIDAARTLREALPGDITFVEDEKHETHLHTSRASAAVVPLSLSTNGLPLIQVADPLCAFAVKCGTWPAEPSQCLMESIAGLMSILR